MSRIPSTRPSETDYLRCEARHSKAAIHGGVRRIADIVRGISPTQVIKQHPILVGFSIAGVSLVIATKLIKSPAPSCEHIEVETHREPARRGRLARLLRFSLRLAANNLISKFILITSEAGATPASDEGDTEGCCP
jgi:hypothetical protein